MPRLYKFALLGFLAYAIVTASPEQQARIGAGLLAIKDAAIEACTREGALCTSAIQYFGATVNRSLSDDPSPWLDEQSKRTAPPAQTTRPLSSQPS